MSTPTTTLVRRAELLAWLAGEGFSESDVKKLIASAVIPKRVYPTSRHEQKQREPRAYYHVPDVAEALQIANPLIGPDRNNGNHRKG